jgi:membrane fusion protein (multidrug efflux system)
MKLLVVMGCLVGVVMSSGCGKQGNKGGPSGAPPEVGVVVVTPERVAITTEMSGRVAPRLIAEVRPQVGGIIKKRLFTEGSDVTAGEVLYEIDPSSYQAALGSAKAAVGRAEANVAPARLKAQRFEELVKIKAVSQQDYDEASAGLKQAEADLEGAKAVLAAASINLAYTYVTAPISGRIGRSSVTTGALVTASQPTALATIQQLDSVYVDVTQSSAEMLRLNRDIANGTIRSNGASQARVKLVLEDGTPYPLTGVLKFSEVTVDQSSGSVTLRTLFPNPKLLLLPGMFVRATLEQGVKERAILVPQQGVTRDQSGNPLVLLVGAEDKVEPRKIAVDRAIGDKWLVTDGLKPGDRLIIEGVQKARPGTQVKVVILGNMSGTAPAKSAAKE